MPHLVLEFTNACKQSLCQNGGGLACLVAKATVFNLFNIFYVVYSVHLCASGTSQLLLCCFNTVKPVLGTTYIKQWTASRDRCSDITPLLKST